MLKLCRVTIFVLVGFVFVFASADLFAQEVNDQEENKGPWKANAGLNAIFNSGNSTSQTIGGNSQVAWKKNRNKVEWTTNGAYGRAKVAGVTQVNTNNFKSTLRYDRFLNDIMSGFALTHLGYDKPAGFDFRGGGALGFAHEVISGPPFLARYEVGPDYTHEEFTTGGNDDVISGRLALTFEYSFSETAKLTENFELLVNLEDSEDTRFFSLTAFSFKLTDIIAFQAGFNYRVDFQPVAGFGKADTTTTLGLLFNFI